VKVGSLGIVRYPLCFLGIPVAALVAASLGACSSMRSEVTINAPPEHVWGVLTDIEAYPQWNPFFVKAKGDVAVGHVLQVTMQPVGQEPKTFSPKVLQIDQLHQLVWRGRLALPWLFDGTHHFVIERLDDHSVKFVQYEDFGGIFVPFVGFEPYRKGWERMNVALKRRAEQPKTLVKPKAAEASAATKL
jgi:hypothetical protein